MSVVIQKVSSIKPEMSFSDSAIKHLISYLTKNPEHLGVRLSVKKTGCSGLSYVIDYVKAPLEGDIVLPLSGDYLVAIDKLSYPFLKNM